ncbi:MAG: DUF2786 domain-containing protein [Acidimicrobiales bacterium]
MGVNNRQRREAKKRQKKQRAGQRFYAGVPPRQDRFDGARVGEGHVDKEQVARNGVLAAAQYFRADPEGGYPATLDSLASIEDRFGPGIIHRAVTHWFDYVLDAAWTRGWQPADVMRHLRRTLTARHAATVAALVAASGGARPEAAVDDRWADQVAAIAGDSTAEPDFSPPSPSLSLAIESLSRLLRLAPLPRLSSSSAGTRRPGGPNSAAMLDRVRALLAKAESTTFPEEAEALTTKAQELMARHAIDAAMLDAAQPRTGPPAVVGWRIGIDDPYAAAKSLLIDRIARANRCQAVWCKDMGFSTVFGDRSDLEMVELLFTSLLVQGTDAMLRAGPAVDRYGTSRTRSFRQSFLVSYASRIGERLATASESAVAEGTERHGEALLPVLVSRAEAVRDAIEEAFPEMVEHGTNISNYSGWLAGRAAADLASLGVSEELSTG